MDQWIKRRMGSPKAKVWSEQKQPQASCPDKLTAARAEYKHIMKQCQVLGVNPAIVMPDHLRNRPELADDE